LAKHISSLSRELGRQVGVLLSRDGIIRNVILGDATRLELPDIGRLRGGTGRFRGLRLIHTHLRGEPITQDDLNDLALLRLDLVAAIQVDENGNPGKIELAHILPVADGSPHQADPYRKVEARDIYNLAFDFEDEIRALESEFSRLTGKRTGGTQKERALVLSITPGETARTEIMELVRASGVEIAEVLPLSGGRIHPRTVVGQGRLQRIALAAMRRSADVAIFDIDLKPAQARAFENTVGLKAVDRTQLILDIFAQRARSRDGKLQVELAQLKYSLPRLTEEDAGLSRLVGGIGGRRGPGETVLEVSRRRVRSRIGSLEKEVENLSKQRALRRRRRIRQGLPVLSIIGYTNAGKSTLLNSLTESRIDTADQMFVTLDPTSRRLRFPIRGDVIITDTVGFIRDLPPDLVAAFRATLEELADAAVLLHVVDASDPNLEKKMDAVGRVLDDLDLRSIPRLIVMNKADIVDASLLDGLCRRFEAVAVSAIRREGLDRLIAAADDLIKR